MHAVVAGILTVVPGLDTAVVLRAAVSRGPRNAFATAIGIGCGTLVRGVAGVSALVTASEVAYSGLRRAWLRRDGVRRGMDVVAGTVVVGFGVKLAVSQR